MSTRWMGTGLALVVAGIALVQVTAGPVVGLVLAATGVVLLVLVVLLGVDDGPDQNHRAALAQQQRRTTERSSSQRNAVTRPLPPVSGG